ncbi:MAG TPA: PF20097 family protein [Dermatophilaceae bacterium]
MNCPTCQALMEGGWIAMWNPIIGQKVRWQKDEPSYSRFRVPKEARVVLAARAGGKDRRVAHRCTKCSTTVIPPDASYDSK